MAQLTDTALARRLAFEAGALLTRLRNAQSWNDVTLQYNQPEPYLPDLLVCRQELAEALLTAIRENHS